MKFAKFFGYITFLLTFFFFSCQTADRIMRSPTYRALSGCPDSDGEVTIANEALGGLEKGSLAKIGESNYLDKMYQGIKNDFESDGFEFKKLEERLQSTGISLEKIKDREGKTKAILVKIDGDLSFDTGKSNLTAAAVKLVDHIADALDAYPETAVSISGHTDTPGTRMGNLRLSKARAGSVHGEMKIRKRIEDGRFREIAGYADDRKIVNTRAAEARNRRVEIRLDPITAIR